MALGRKASLSLKLTDPNELVRSTSDLLQRLVGDEVHLEIELASSLPAVSVDPLEIERALVNLVVNARDVMPSGGVVGITTASRTFADATQVEISVADQGPGIDEQDLPHIFEPFYTTRTAAGGTGLGLATVQGTAVQHGGSVRVQSSPHGGSIFTLILPAATAKASLRSLGTEPASRSSDLGRRLRFLIVDDEPMVADVARRILEAEGHAVRATSQPEEALALWREIGANIDLVICDVVMAQMRGPELVARLCETDPKPRVLFITGYSEEAVRAELKHPVLIKPFSASTLLKAINDAM